jgi:coiled-coil domain-containing protein 77
MSSKKSGKNTSSSLNIPTVDERLGYLRPSRELLEYYRKKIGEYDIEREDLIKKLDKIKDQLDDQVNIIELNYGNLS